MAIPAKGQIAIFNRSHYEAAIEALFIILFQKMS
jgi:polyphosphate kinase 2 (PPK2 family)